MERTARARRDRPEPGTATDLRPVHALIASVLTGAGLAIALWQISGPPSVPAASDLAELAKTLTRSQVSDAQMIAVGTSIAWVLLIYLALTTAIRVTVIAAVRVTGGARWARAALRVSHLITVPAVRRIVDGGAAGVLLLSTSLAGPSRALAVAPAKTWMVVDQSGVGATVRHSPDLFGVDAFQNQAPAALEYTVQRGDSLWDIARRLYGDGSRYVEIFEANRDREMPRGGRLVAPRLVEPGWVLAIPLPAQHFSAGEVPTYRVQSGDDLWGVAARFLGDGFRWVEVFDANRDREMADGRRFTDPSLIYPGWVLELPLAMAQEVPGSRTAPPTAAAEPARSTPSPRTPTSAALRAPEPEHLPGVIQWGHQHTGCCVLSYPMD